MVRPVAHGRHGGGGGPGPSSRAAEPAGSSHPTRSVSMLRITRIRTAAVITAAWLAVGCSGAGAQGGVVEAFVPDAVYHNAKVVTVNQNFEIAQAVAIRDGRFVAVGSNQEVLALAGRSTQVVELGGRTVVPGFYDNHIHLGAELQGGGGGRVGGGGAGSRAGEAVGQVPA